MIPARLYLRNFLSYGESCDPIDLTGVHIACLCGSNGHGKSALLDAITWSLWGQARTSSADDLVRLGQSSMVVEFEFLLDGEAYRVTRKRTRGRTSQSDLQLQARQADGAWRALTGQGVRGTQERINHLLRMEHDTFINSAFILQGRADEFARKTAGERKRILGEILSLGVYDQLTEKCRGLRQEALGRTQGLELQIAELEKRFSQVPGLRAEVQRLELAQQQARLERERSEVALERARLAVSALEGRRREREGVARLLSDADAEIRRLNTALTQLVQRLRRIEEQLPQAPAIRARHAELTTLRAEQEATTARLSELRRLETEQRAVERRVELARAALQSRVDQSARDVQQLDTAAREAPALRRDVITLSARCEELARLEQQREDLDRRLPELAARRAKHEAEQKQIAERLEAAGDRFHLLRDAKAACPVCEGELTAEKRLELGRALRAEMAQLKEDGTTALESEQAARAEAEATVRERARLDRDLKESRSLQGRLAQKQQALEQSEGAAADLPAKRDEHLLLSRDLENGAFAQADRALLAEYASRIAAVAVNDARLAEIAAAIRKLAGVERELQGIEQAEAEHPALRDQVGTQRELVAAREAGLREDRDLLRRLEQELRELPEVEAEAGRQQQTLERSRQAESRCDQQLGAAREALSQAEALRERIDALRSERVAAARDQAAYEELVKAFGRNGLQALIVENAIPEIEQEANDLLRRMSDGQLSLELRTQRELRSGAQAETLEIQISDGLGQRRYELFSGGEAFRVNFALRIALSKLLARRAGARLETLVIDEGFGSQDQEGRMRLVEAIHTVRDDFAQILVITHLDDLKDAFPTRIEVSKGPGGSQVAIF
jgi:exonuclease SbcC